jgi:Ran-interacting Mog1 protein
MDPPESVSGADDDCERRLLVIEILDFQSSVNNENAAKYHFQDLAEANSLAFPSADAHFTPSSIMNDQLLTPSSLGLPAGTVGLFCSSGTGHQRVKQDNTAAPKWLRVDLCVIRLPHVQTDLLVTLSAPSESNLHQGVEQTASCFHEILSSIRIRDWGLFNSGQ